MVKVPCAFSRNLNYRRHGSYTRHRNTPRAVFAHVEWGPLVYLQSAHRLVRMPWDDTDFQGGDVIPIVNYSGDTWRC